jgi:prolyl 4-hydroxylase
MQLKNWTNNIFTIENFWKEQECRDFIVKSEALGYEPATIDTEKGQIVLETIRNNNRFFIKTLFYQIKFGNS